MSKPAPGKAMARRKEGKVPAAGAALEARRAQRLRTAELLNGGRTPLHVIEVAAHAGELAERTIAEALVREPPQPPLACRAGCDWCCYKKVGVAAPEVLRIAAYLRVHQPQQTIQDIVARIEARAAQRNVLAGDHWTADRLPCPLLEDHRCLAYPVRPLTCRGYTSSNAQRCERSAKSREPPAVPVYGPALQATAFILDGMCSGLTEAGLAGSGLDLAKALRSALTIPDAGERWLAGEPLFETARLV
jgi:Fe-S-cluster containining protein